LRIQSVSKTITPIDNRAQTGRPTLSPSTTITKYYELLILALVFPAIVINIYGILAVASHLYLEDAPYLILLFVLFIPIGVILFLVKKLH
jgi:FtsH-binding integral membrane protein